MSHLFTEINVRKKVSISAKKQLQFWKKFLIHLPGKSRGVNSRQWSQFCSKLLLLAAKQWQGGKAWACCVLQISHLVQEKLRLWTQYLEIFLRFLIPFPVVLCVTAHIKKNTMQLYWGWVGRKSGMLCTNQGIRLNNAFPIPTASALAGPSTVLSPLEEGNQP